METTDLKHEECISILRPIRDALDVLNGKWKLPIIVALTFGEKRFGEISKEVHGITDRMLSKELRDMEVNGLVKRTVYDTYPVKVTYMLTPRSEPLARSLNHSVVGVSYTGKNPLGESVNESSQKLAMVVITAVKG